jgi:hypothetical protein
MALGSKGDQPWRVGIQHPRQPGPLATCRSTTARRSAPRATTSATSSSTASATPTCSTRAPASPARHAVAHRADHPGPKAGTLSDAASKPNAVIKIKSQEQPALNHQTKGEECCTGVSFKKPGFANSLVCVSGC